MFKKTETVEPRLTLCHNFIVDIADGKPVTVPVKDVRKSTEYSAGVIDKRLDLLSINSDNVNPLDLYLSYVQMLYSICNDQMSSSDNNMSHFLTNLDLGYAPIICTPCCDDGDIQFVSLAVYRLGLARLSELKIPYIKKYTARPDGRNVSAQFNDIWVHKQHIADFMNVSVEHIRLGDFIRRVLV